MERALPGRLPLKHRARSRVRRGRRLPTSRAREFAPLQPGLSVRATPHLSTTLNVDVVHVLLVLESLASWLTEQAAELRRGLVPLRSRQSLGADGQFAVCGDGNDELSHTSDLSEPHPDGDCTIGCSGKTDRSVVSTLRL